MKVVVDPGNIWKVWDDFGIADADMIGYWVPDCPVKTNHKDILATVYVKKNQTLVAIASWAGEKTDVKLTFDWSALKINPEVATLRAPEILNFQQVACFHPDNRIPVEPARGWLLVISEETPGHC